MRHKIIIIIGLLILLTGCTSEYTLEISNNKFEEEITVVIPDSAIPQPTQEVLDGQVDLDDQITPFIEGKTEALITNDKFYTKKVTKKDNFTFVDLKYSYDEKEFEKANSINTCFEYPELDFSNNYYINLQGAFYCLYGDSIDVKIKTKNKVVYNNADEVTGNTYIWHIDEKNVDYVDIKMNIKKGTPNNVLVGVILAVIGIAIASIIGYKFYTKNKKRNNI